MKNIVLTVGAILSIPFIVAGMLFEFCVYGFEGGRNMMYALSVWASGEAKS
jgi:hypothetical protein